MIKNSSGHIFYGMHFYPGLAQYDEPNGKSSKIYLNEETLRKMDPTFAGKPIFVEHVDEVTPNLDELKKEADGWVVESFFNEADGKHWVKIVVVSQDGLRSIKNGYKLSNAYMPNLNNKSGVWNGIAYDNEVVDGEYEHLAIVRNPRYDESVIMTPEEFKNYNENLKKELNRISNSMEDMNIMAFKFWNRKPIENSVDYENTFVTLPRSKKEFSIYHIVNEMDKMEEKKKENMADGDMKVKLHDGKMCNVDELVEKYKNMCMKNKKKKNEEMEEEGLAMEEHGVDVEGDFHNEEEDEHEHEDHEREMKKNKKMKKNDEEDEKAKKKALELAEHEEDEIEEDEEYKKKNKKKNSRNIEYFNSLKNAPLDSMANEEKIELSMDKIARGKARYGSNK